LRAIPLFVILGFVSRESSYRTHVTILPLRAERNPDKYKHRRSNHDKLHLCRSKPHTTPLRFPNLGYSEGKIDRGRIDNGLPEHRDL
jgi:hypothetical protein